MKEYKKQATRLKTHLKTAGIADIKHAQALHAIAAIHGHRNWQTLNAQEKPTGATTATVVMTTATVVIPEIATGALSPVASCAGLAEQNSRAFVARCYNHRRVSIEPLLQLRQALKDFGTDVVTDGDKYFTALHDQVAEVQVADLVGDPLKLFSVVYHHRHGVDAYLYAAANQPDDEEAIKALDIDFEPDRNEYLDISAIEIPKNYLDWLSNQPTKSIKIDAPTSFLEEVRGWIEGDLQAANEAGEETSHLTARLAQLNALIKKANRSAIPKVAIIKVGKETICINGRSLDSTFERDSNSAEYNGALDGIESLLLALHGAGINLNDPRVNAAVEEAVSSAAENCGEDDNAVTAKKCWRDLGEIPITNDGNIDRKFRHFKKGTHREVIWKWIEKTYGCSIHEPQNPEGE